MGYIREPKNIDLVVGPSILTEDAKNNIQQAIAQYKKTGKKPESVGQAIIKISARYSRTQSAKTKLQHHP